MFSVRDWRCLVMVGVMLGEGRGEVRLNEWMAANTRVYPDMVDFEDYPDWVELYNPESEVVSLEGVYLSDDSEKPFKWGFPAGASLAAGGYLVVRADGHDAVPGEVKPRGYWPWRSFTVEGYHTNFSLSAAGESLVLTRATGLGREVLVQEGTPAPGVPVAVWRYRDTGENLGVAWREPGYSDGDWASGPSQLGYGDGGEATVVASGGAVKHVTTYFRHRFNLTDPSAYLSLELKLLVDDGAVVYLNGKEVVRNNLPEGEVLFPTLAKAAISGADESNYDVYRLSSDLLVAGENVLAVEVHQNATSSSDLSFDLGLRGVTYQQLELLERVDFGVQVDDVSMGRAVESPAEWVGYATPTPGEANGGKVVEDLRKRAVGVEVSLESGFYQVAQAIELSAGGAEIRYTLDGSDPGLSSPLYTEPLSIQATTVLRARAYEDGCPAGVIETRTYFFGESPGQVPYVSLVADPEVLFGDEKGIYYNQHEPLVSSSSNAALGLRDVYKGKDAPGNLEFFEPGGGGFRVNGGIRMGGENNWVHGQRAMNFALRGKYGDDAISYDLFPGTGVPIHTGLTLRDGGDAWNREMLRDGMWAALAKGCLRVDVAEYRPSVLFLNGQYWGIHDLRSRWDDAWFFQYKRVNPDEVDHLLYGHVTSSSTTLGVEKGDAQAWLELLDFVKGQDLAVAANYATVAERVDVDSFIDFVVAESYGLNTSWYHNREFWRERKAGAKWQWFLPDMDQTFRTSQLSTSVLEDMLGNDVLLKEMVKSPVFRARLAQRFAAHMASTFSVARVHGVLEAMAVEVEPEVVRHVGRWSSWGGMTLTTRSTNLQQIRDFVTSRAGGVMAEVSQKLGVGAVVDLSVATSGVGHGEVRIAGVVVAEGVVRVVPNLPFSLEAKAAPGYRFSHWVGVSGGAEVEIQIAGAAAVTAVFEPVAETLVGGSLEGGGEWTAVASPYVVTEDLIVPAGQVLTIGPGVEVRLLEGVNVRVQGRLVVAGAAGGQVEFKGREGARWGGISFEQAEGVSSLSHVRLRGATSGYDATVYPYAISGLHSAMEITFLDVDECEGPVFLRGGSVVMADSRLRTPYTGDCINVKGGLAEVRRCVFLGNDAPDTDAIDYDGVVNGVIADNHIYRFRGSNSDGVDIGESCVNVLIEGNRVYYSSDKGFSVGQGSTAVLRKNLVVGCVLGIGVKDEGSLAEVDQNTFVDCEEGVAVYEKNFGEGGGRVVVTNTLFSGMRSRVVSVDDLSELEVRYSLCDTVRMDGEGNVREDPSFVDRAALNFELREGSPAVDAGDPEHVPDPDGTRADIGALYVYQASDYPYTIRETVVIDEVMARPEVAGRSWVELRNRTAQPVEVGGWYLSDDAADLKKYRIAEGTVIEGNGCVVLEEAVHYGVGSVDPGRAVAFSLKAGGGVLYLSSGGAGQLSDYRTEVSYGASREGVSVGNVYRPSAVAWDFVSLAAPTPGGRNRGPMVGPVVISEVVYAPSGQGEAEYVELLNVSEEPVTLKDGASGLGWRLSDGVEYGFPAVEAVVMEPGERLILTRSLTAFEQKFGVAEGIRVIEWSAGRLSNEGDGLQLLAPGVLGEGGVRSYVLMDRVVYGVTAPWPDLPGGGVWGISRLEERGYGDDVANWVAMPATPGRDAGTSYAAWRGEQGWGGGADDGEEDQDADGIANLIEFASGGGQRQSPLRMRRLGDEWCLDYEVRGDRAGVAVSVEVSDDLSAGSWVRVESAAVEISGVVQRREVRWGGMGSGYFRLVYEEVP